VIEEERGREQLGEGGERREGRGEERGEEGEERRGENAAGSILTAPIHPQIESLPHPAQPPLHP
jgi:hypothetical protein